MKSYYWDYLLFILAIIYVVLLKYERLGGYDFEFLVVITFFVMVAIALRSKK